MAPQCDLSNPDFVWSYCPSNAAAILFAFLFSAPTAYHIYQAWRFRKPFAAVLIMGGLWEVLGYGIRSISINNPFTSGLYTAQMLLILLAPLWVNAFIYMLMGRMIHFFFDDDRVFGVKARRLTLIFVAFDITAFLIQGTGGSLTSSTEVDTIKTGLNVYTGGVALQIVFNAIFLAIVARFHLTAQKILRAPGFSSTAGQNTPRSFADCLRLLYVVYGIIGLILFRNFYRLAEFASGLDNTIIKHEWYAYVFDALPMLTALVLLNVFHPAHQLKGDRSDFSDEDKARKLARQEKKAAKKAGRTAVIYNKVPLTSSVEMTSSTEDVSRV